MSNSSPILEETILATDAPFWFERCVYVPCPRSAGRLYPVAGTSLTMVRVHSSTVLSTSTSVQRVTTYSSSAGLVYTRAPGIT